MTGPVPGAQREPLRLGAEDPRYPPGLRDLEDQPAVLWIAGDPSPLLGAASPAVAIVGARSPSPYGLQTAAALGRGLAGAGVPVVSGMARGIDTAAHLGALEAGGVTVAVVAGGAERAHPPSGRALYERIRVAGAIVSERPPGSSPRPWSFAARNRLIAALAAMTVVVEARPGSGSLLTAAAAVKLGRAIGAVPGRVTSPLAAGPHRLIAGGARLISDAADVLAALGVTVGDAAQRPAGRGRGRGAAPEGLPAAELALWRALADGHATPAAIARAGLSPAAALAALAALELGGLIARGPGGRWTVCPP